MNPSNASCTSPAARLQMRGVEKRFGPTKALVGVELVVHAGEIHALIGENGAGKSTLMKILAGALQPDAGEITIDGAPYRPATPSEGRRAGVGMIFQELSLAPHLSVMENLFLGALQRRGPFVDRRSMRHAAIAALEEIGRPEIRPEARVADLSAADRQLVEIARALAMNARVLVLDEPTTSLGSNDVQRVFALLRRLRERGVASIYISHMLEDVIALADRFTVLRDGRSVLSGTMESTNANALVKAMVGREIKDLYVRTPAEPGSVLIKADALEGDPAPKRASFELRRGEVLGIAGLLGSGRTSLLRTLFGLEEVKSGRLRIAAFEGQRQPRALWRSGVGFLSEDRKSEGLALRRSIAENLMLPCLRKAARRGWLGPRAMDAASAPFQSALNLRCRDSRQRVSELSGGNQQKIAFGRLLAADADILLLDEPTRGIDVGAKAEIYAWIDQLAHDPKMPVEKRKAVLLVSSYLPEVLGISDRVAVMKDGTLLDARPASAVSEATIILEATTTTREKA